MSFHPRRTGAMAAGLAVAVLGAALIAGPACAVTVTPYATALPTPHGSVFDPAGNLYVLTTPTKIVVVPPGGGPTHPTFANATGTKFFIVRATSGDFYVSLPNQNKVVQITPAGVVSTYVTGLTGYALAIDGADTLYGATAGVQIVRITGPGVTTPVATVPAPATQIYAMTADSAGNIYATTDTDTVYRVAPGGEVSAYATIPATTTTDNEGVALGAAGELYVSNVTDGVIYQVPSGGGGATPYVTGLSRPFELTTRGTSLYFSSAVTDEVDAVSIPAPPVPTLGETALWLLAALLGGAGLVVQQANRRRG